MDMTGQPRLFVTAFEAINFQALHEGHHGWSLMRTARRQGETWGSTPPEFYGALGTEELLDVWTAQLAQDLGL